MNLNSYVPPVPIPPVAPNFAFCSAAYGTGLTRNDALHAGGQLPRGTRPVTYSVGESDIDNLATNISVPQRNYQLPLLLFFGGVALGIDVSGPIQISEISVVPDDIRGMAGYVATHCVGRGGVGGFVTKRIQGLVDFVTDPTSDIDAPVYPDSTAFLTVTVSNHQNWHNYPGDYDPQMARFLWRAELDAFEGTDPFYREVIAERMGRFARVEAQMRRLGTDVPWWGPELVQVQGNRTAATSVQLANITSESVATARRRKRVAGLLRSKEIQ